MSDDKKANDRYFTNQEEFQILKDNINKYFSFQKRSQNRKSFIIDITKKLNELHPDQWNEKKVRVWFTNNQNRLLNGGDLNEGQDLPPPNNTALLPNQNNPNNQIVITRPQELTPRPPMTTFDEKLTPNQPNSYPLNIQPIQPIQPIPIVSQQPQPILMQSSAELVPTPSQDLAFSLRTNSSSAYFQIYPNICSQDSNLISSQQPIKVSQIESTESSTPATAITAAQPIEPTPSNSTVLNNTSEEEEGAENAEDSDGLPELPIITEITDSKKDQIKYDLYRLYLPNCYRYFRKLKSITDPKVRLEKQERLEDRFVQFLDIFPRIDVKNIYAKDVSTPHLYSKNNNSIGRTVSRTTQCYNDEPVDNEPDNIEMVEGSPYIYYSKAFRVPPKLCEPLKSFYYGKYNEGDRKCTTLKNIEVGTFIPETGDTICVVWNEEYRMHQISLGDASSVSGFFLPPHSIVVHENKAWIQGDVRVRAFDLSSLECVDTLYIGPDIILKSAVAIWNGSVAVGANDKIYLYDLHHSEAQEKENSKFKSQFERYPSSKGLGPSVVSWTKGRKHRGVIKDDRIKTITSMIPVGQNLVVASEDYPVIHVYGPDQTIIARLTGHTMGITSLYSCDPNCFFSGSKDMTIKRWNMTNFITDYGYIKHGDDVTAITTAKYYDHEFLFTASKDSKILVWDLSSKRSTFEIDISNGYFPMAVMFTPSSSTLSIIVVENCVTESGMMENYNKSQNNQDQIQTFTFSKE